MEKKAEYLPIFAFISGIALSLSMPGSELGFFAWIGFIPLIVIIYLSESRSYALKSSFLFGFGYNLVYLSWLLGLHPLNWLGMNSYQSMTLAIGIWIFLSVYTALYHCLFGFAVYSILKKGYNPILGSFLIALIWIIIMNILLSIGEFGFPWSLIEYSQYKNLYLLQFAKYIGGIGIAFLILFANSLISYTIIGKLEHKYSYTSIILRLITIFAVIFLLHYKGFHLLKAPKAYNKTITATIIQSNIAVEDKKSNIDDIKQFFLSKINSAPSGIIVIPETAISDFIRINDIDYYKNLQNIAAKQNKTLIIGTIDYDLNGKYLYPTNSAIIMDKLLNKSDRNIYHKQYLVPFGEYVPFSRIIPDKLKEFASIASKFDYYRGKTIKVFKTSSGNIAPSICYEIVFPMLIKFQTVKGADVLVNLSNLAWFRDTVVKDQFIAFSVLRAAESEKPVIVAVNTGKSVIIDSTGKILSQGAKNTTGLVTHKIGYKK